MRIIVLLLTCLLSLSSCEALKELMPPSISQTTSPTKKESNSKKYTVNRQYLNYLENEGHVTSWAYQNLLVNAVESKNTADIKKYIDLGANPNRGKDDIDKESAIYRAAKIGCKECLAAMALKANFNYSWKTCWKLPIAGAAHHSVNMMQHLLDQYGIDLNATSIGKYGKNTALKAIVHKSVPGAISFMLQNGANPNYGVVTAWNKYIFERDIRKANSNEVLAFLNAGANINECNTLTTALGYSIDMKQFDIAKILIEKGANPNYVEGKMDRGRPAIYYAIKRDDFKTLKLLVDNGANVNSNSFWEGAPTGSPLEQAVKDKRDQRIIEYLISHGAQ